MPSSRSLPIRLSGGDYAELERRALANERDPLQEARFILKQHLRRESRDPKVQPRREERP